MNDQHTFKFRPMEGTPLDDDEAVEVKAEVCDHGMGLLLSSPGYSDCNSNAGEGQPILIEKHEGMLRVIIWGDINQEDPTHVISLEGARESARKED